MHSVFSGHHLGHLGCSPKRFRYNRQKSTVVADCIGSVHRVYPLFNLRVAQGQKNRQHSRRKADRLRSASQAPQQQTLEMGGFTGAGITQDDNPPLPPLFGLEKGFRNRNFKTRITLTQRLFCMISIQKDLIRYPSKIQHGVQGDVNLFVVDWNF